MEFRQLLMRLSIITIGITLFFTHVGAHSLAQEVTHRKRNASLKEVLEAITKQTGYHFLYQSSKLNDNQKIDTDFKEEQLTTVLEQVLEKQGLSYTFRNKTIVIRPAAAPSEHVRSTTVQQQRTIRGNVVDSLGNPLSHVSIRLKDTDVTASTDAGGNFSLRVHSGTPTPILIFSSIGYRTREIEASSDRPLTVRLEQVVTQMTELVVTGLVTRNEHTYTGATTTISKEDLQRTGNINLVQALGNLSPTFHIITNNEIGSDPNATLDIQMRGASSFSDMRDRYSTSPNQPLFIVDGFETPLQKVVDMDMNRVESVTMLKDAAAKAIYGSKGANGVIVIETIKPEKGKTRVSYIANLNIQAPDLTSYNLANALEKLEIEDRAGVYHRDYLPPGSNAMRREEYNRLYQEIMGGADVNWMKIPLRTGVGQKHTLNVEGGDESLVYNASVAYNDVKGVMKGSDRQTIDGLINLSYRYKNLIFREQLNVMTTASHDSPYGNFGDYAKMNPYWRAYNEDGTIRRVVGTYNIANAQGTHPIYNPLLNAQSNYKKTGDYLNVTNNFYIEWQALKELRFTGRVGISKEKGENHLFYPSNYAPLNPNQTYNGVNINFIGIEPNDEELYFKRGLYEITNNDAFSLASEVGANYTKYFGKHLLFADAIYSVSEKRYDYLSTAAIGFPDRATSITQALSYQENAKPSGYGSVQRDLGVIGSLNYSYDSRYLMDASYRANASSLFGTDRRWGSFWAVGLGWNLHRESFMQDATGWLDQLKLRTSTGYTGSQNFAPYQANAMYRYFLEDVYDNHIGAELIGLPNPFLGWQRTRDDNIGFDLSVFNKIDVRFDLYQKITNNMLTPVAVVTSTGFNVYQENLGKTANRGFELDARYRIIADAQRETYFSVFASVASNKNKIVEINNALSTMNETKDRATTGADSGIYPDHEQNKDELTRPKVRYEEGQSLSAIWAVRSLGINPADGREVFLDANGNRVFSWNPEDQIVVGDALERYRGNFGFSLDYKGFTVNSIFTFRFGGQQYNTTLVDKVENVDLQYNVDRRAYTDTWTTEGQQAQFKRVTDPAYFTNPTSRFVFDLNEVRMANLSVGYDFRNWDFVQRGNSISSLRATLSMNDVFTLSSIRQERGTVYPFARAFVFTLQSSF